MIHRETVWFERCFSVPLNFPRLRDFTEEVRAFHSSLAVLSKILGDYMENVEGQAILCALARTRCIFINHSDISKLERRQLSIRSAASVEIER